MYVQTYTNTHSHARMSGTLHVNTCIPSCKYMYSLVYDVRTNAHKNTLTHAHLRHTAIYVYTHISCMYTNTPTHTHTHASQAHSM